MTTNRHCAPRQHQSRYADARHHRADLLGDPSQLVLIRFVSTWLGSKVLSRFTVMWLRTCLMAMMLLVSGCTEVREVSYRTFVDAEREGAFSRRIVSKCLSSDASSINAAYDMDTGDRWVRFSLNPSTADAFERTLQPPDPRMLSQRIKAPNRTWWPRDLAGVLRPDSLRADGYRLYTMVVDQDVSGLLALRGGEGFCWVPPWE